MSLVLGAAWPRRPSDVFSPCCLLLQCPLQVCRLPIVQPLPPLRPVDVSVLRGLPAQRGSASARLVGYGPVRVGSWAGVGPLPLLTLPVLASVSASSSSESLDSAVRFSVIPPPHSDDLA